MPEQKESSVLFSLKELMNLEEDRIRQEEDDKKRKAEAEVQARLEAERRARDEEESRIRAEEERQHQDEQRKKEEAARLEAIRHAEIEKARVEAEQKARMQAITQQQEHERHLSTLQHDEHKKKLQRLVFVISGCAAILLVGSLSIYFGKIKPDQEARERATTAALAEREAEAQRKARELESLQLKVSSLLSQLEGAKSDADKAALKAKIAEAQNAAAKIQKGGGGTGSGRSGGEDKPAKKACNCQPGDPLCSCL